MQVTASAPSEQEPSMTSPTTAPEVPAFTVHRIEDGADGKVLEIHDGWAPPTTDPSWVRTAAAELLTDYDIAFDPDHDRMQAIPGMDATWLVSGLDADEERVHVAVNLALQAATVVDTAELDQLDRQDVGVHLMAEMLMSGHSNAGYYRTTFITAAVIIALMIGAFWGVNVLIDHLTGA
jgi:hypothetical protein